MLFPFRTRSIFRSRWIALLWSAGVVWTAVEVAAPPEPVVNEVATHDDAETTGNLAQVEALVHQLEAR